MIDHSLGGRMIIVISGAKTLVGLIARDLIKLSIKAAGIFLTALLPEQLRMQLLRI